MPRRNGGRLARDARTLLHSLVPLLVSVVGCFSCLDCRRYTTCTLLQEIAGEFMRYAHRKAGSFMLLRGVHREGDRSVRGRDSRQVRRA